MQADVNTSYNCCCGRNAPARTPAAGQNALRHGLKEAGVHKRSKACIGIRQALKGVSRPLDDKLKTMYSLHHTLSHCRHIDMPSYMPSCAYAGHPHTHPHNTASKQAPMHPLCQSIWSSHLTHTSHCTCTQGLAPPAVAKSLQRQWQHPLPPHQP